MDYGEGIWQPICPAKETTKDSSSAVAGPSVAISTFTQARQLITGKG